MAATAFYEEYINSPRWQRTRLRKLRTAIWDKTGTLCRCERCGLMVPKSVIHVHHLTYKRLGRERLVDLQTICDGCHRVEHGKPAPPWWIVATDNGRSLSPKINVPEVIELAKPLVLEFGLDPDTAIREAITLCNPRVSLDEVDPRWKVAERPIAEVLYDAMVEYDRHLNCAG